MTAAEKLESMTRTFCCDTGGLGLDGMSAGGGVGSRYERAVCTPCRRCAARVPRDS